MFLTALLVPVSAQVPTTSTTSTSSSTTSTTVDPSTPTSTTTVPGSSTSTSASTSTSSTTTTTADPDQEEVEGFDFGSKLAGFLLRRMTATPRLDLAAPVGVINIAELQLARAAVVASEQAHRRLLADIGSLERDLREVNVVAALLGFNQQDALAEVAVAQATFEQRAADAYVRGRDPDWTVLFASEDANEALTRSELLQAVLEADEAAVVDYFEKRDALDVDTIDLLDTITRIERQLRAARLDEERVRSEMGDALVEVAVWEAGSRVMAQGFLFPVFGGNSFRDSWGEPRSGGRSHKGVDIMAAQNTPLVASEDGQILRMNSSGAGGIQLTLRGATGLEYFYAHLSGYARGVRPGDVVTAGTIIGYVGQTGNAVGSHVHFEVHENGVAVNPYPLVRAAWDFQGVHILDAANRIAAAGGPEATAEDLVLLDEDEAVEGDFGYGDDDEEPLGLGEEPEDE
jgi:murein DD-endopeptidase MepM/ murein hydrolase activator NlpD